MTLVELQAQRDKLVAALGRPERVIQFEDRRIENFSADELLTAIAGLDIQIAAGQPQESRVFTVASSSGFAGNGQCCGDSFEVWR
jgi:hypothetical protein